MVYNNIFDIELHISQTHISFAGHRIPRMSGNVRVFDTLMRLNDTIDKTPAMIGAGYDAEIYADGKAIKTLISINKLSGTPYDGVWEVTETIAEEE